MDVEEVEAWYVERVLEIDAETGMLENGVSLVQFAREKGIATPSLDDLERHLACLQVLLTQSTKYLC